MLGPRRFLSVMWPLLAVIACLFVLAAIGIYVLTAARAYVGGEGLWSKAQKEAVAHLLRYAETGAESDFQAYRASIAVNLGDRKARLELDKPAPDLAIVRQGFLEGRNHPDDIDGMIFLYLRFRDVSYIRKAIDIWSKADGLIEQLDAHAQALRREVAADPGGAKVKALVAQINAVDRQLTPMEDDFSYTIGEASRWVKELLLVGGLAIAMLLVLIGVLLSRRNLLRLQQADEALRRSEARFRSLTELSSDWYWEQDADYRFTLVSGGRQNRPMRLPGVTMIGQRRWELPGATPLGMSWAEHREHVAARRPIQDFRFSHLTDNGEVRYISVSGVPSYDRNGAFTGYQGISRDITERLQAEERLQRVAFHDALTGLPNRALIEDRIAQAILDANRAKSRMAVMFVDLDCFKDINDTLGHEAGDAVLREVAARLSGRLRGSDTIGRLGGDEFVVLLRKLASRDEAATVAGSLVDVLRQPVVYGVRRIDIGASIGIGIYPDDGLERAELLRAADAAMYKAKANAIGSRFAFSSPGENTSPGRGRLRAAGSAARTAR